MTQLSDGAPEAPLADPVVETPETPSRQPPAGSPNPLVRLIERLIADMQADLTDRTAAQAHTRTADTTSTESDITP